MTSTPRASRASACCRSRWKRRRSVTPSPARNVRTSSASRSPRSWPARWNGRPRRRAIPRAISVSGAPGRPEVASSNGRPRSPSRQQDQAGVEAAGRVDAERAPLERAGERGEAVEHGPGAARYRVRQRLRAPPGRGAVGRQLEDLAARELVDSGDEGPGPEHLPLGEELEHDGEVEVGPAGAAGPGQSEEAGGRAAAVVEDLVEAGVVDRDLPAAAPLVVDEETEDAGGARRHLREVRALQGRPDPGHARRAGRLARKVEVPLPADREAVVLPPAEAVLTRVLGTDLGIDRHGSSGRSGRGRRPDQGGDAHDGEPSADREGVMARHRSRESHRARGELNSAVTIFSVGLPGISRAAPHHARCCGVGLDRLTRCGSRRQKLP